MGQPCPGRAMGMTDEAFGIRAGTAANDTSSVVATDYAFGEGAGGVSSCFSRKTKKRWPM